jgi:bacterioferritin-associated ferredoxin
MYVCVCMAVTDSQILAAVGQGHASMKALRDHLGVASECGRCARCASDLLKTCKGCGKCSTHEATSRPTPLAHLAPSQMEAHAAHA